jgi:hypothetical protein
LKAPRKKPAGKPGKASAKTSPAKAKKPVASNVALPEPLFYSDREEFLWLKDAVRLEQGAGEDYAPVRASVDKARSLVTHLMRREMAQDDLARFKKPSKHNDATLREWMALQDVKATGSAKDRLVGYEIEQARQRGDGKFFIKIGRALSLKKRPPVIDYERVQLVARFLVDNWCNPPGQASYAMWLRLLKTDEFSADNGAPLFDKSKPFYFLPPLAFLSENVRARFCADYLGRDRNDADMKPHAITQWVTKLGLKAASRPRINGIKLCMVQDGKKLIKLDVVT